MDVPCRRFALMWERWMRKSALWLAAQIVPVSVWLATDAPAHAYELGDAPPLLVGSPVSTHYDGITNDLLTAGLGKSGLGLETPPAVSTPPTVEELRRLAIWTNYRALVDPTPGGGYGLLYGPNVAADGTVTSSEG
ncbi:MAG: hypothetical protein JOZ58_19915, partial [Acetobacteraceae bacterium]|nr:hypothetical protein [Acetobacteraceae bacterium]